MFNMIECPGDEQLSVTRFLLSECVKISEIYGQMTVQYGDNCMSPRKVYEWVENFEGGRTIVDGDARPGRPSAVTRVKVKEQVEESARAVDISHGKKRR
jgi:hypothetical protein